MNRQLCVTKIFILSFLCVSGAFGNTLNNFSWWDSFPVSMISLIPSWAVTKKVIQEEAASVVALIANHPAVPYVAGGIVGALGGLFINQVIDPTQEKPESFTKPQSPNKLTNSNKQVRFNIPASGSQKSKGDPLKNSSIKEGKSLELMQLYRNARSKAIKHIRNDFPGFKEEDVTQEKFVKFVNIQKVIYSKQEEDIKDYLVKDFFMNRQSLYYTSRFAMHLDKAQELSDKRLPRKIYTSKPISCAHTVDDD